MIALWWISGIHLVQVRYMRYEPETPFDNIESGLEYVNYLLEATEEAQKQIETEIERTTDATLARRRQALQLVRHKLVTLASHVSKSRGILNDLRTLRRLLLGERREPNGPLEGTPPEQA